MNTTMLTNVASSNKVRILVGGALVFTTGAAGGYFLGKRRGYAEAVATIEDRIKFHLSGEEAPVSTDPQLPFGEEVDYSQYDTSTKAGDAYVVEVDEAGPVEWRHLEEAEELMEAERRLVDDPDMAPAVQRIRNFLEGRELVWDYDHETALRASNDIYVIHEDEFNTQEFENFEQSSWTWYSGDDIMLNDMDEVVLGYVKFVGDATKMPFGYGSNSEDTIHIRNVKLELEVAIQKHDGHYAVEVLGYEPGTIYVPYDPDSDD